MPSISFGDAIEVEPLEGNPLFDFARELCKLEDIADHEGHTAWVDTDLWRRAEHTLKKKRGRMS